VQHIPRARQHQVTYAGWFANALGNLNPKQESQVEDLAEKTQIRQMGQVAHSDLANLGGVL
jgi:hypothetical protein